MLHVRSAARRDLASRLRRTGLALAAAVSFASVLPHGAALGAGAQPPPGTAITFDLRALDRDGKPITDLKPGELVLKINGQPREIRSLELLRFAAEEDLEAATPPPSLPPAFSTNVFSGSGREVFLVFEDESIGVGNDQPPREAALRLLDALEPRDRVAVLTVPRGGVNLGLTTDRERVRSTLAQRLGRAGRQESEADAACRTRETLGALKSVIDSVKGGPGTTIVFFSSGITPPTSDNLRIGLGSGGPLCLVQVTDYNEMGEGARGARAAVFVVYLIDGALGSAANSSAGLESLAGVTDGELIRLGRSNAPVLTRVARETGASYLVSFESTAADRSNPSLRVDMRTTRENVTLRTRAVLTPGRLGRRGAVKAASPRDMLRTGTMFGELPLRVVTYASRNADDDRVKLVVLFEPVDPATRITAAATGVFDAKGSLKAQSTSNKEDFAASPTMSVLAVPAGFYRVRLAATDAAGRAGTVDLETKVELTGAGPLKLSTLVLGDSGTGAFAPRLQFGAEPAAVGYLELYGLPSSGALSVTFELLAADGTQVISRAPGSVRPTSFEDLRLAVGSLPIAALQSGDYLVRALVSIDGKEVGRTERTLRKK